MASVNSCYFDFGGVSVCVSFVFAGMELLISCVLFDAVILLGLEFSF